MNVYDFDKTIYDGDSSFDFCLFCIRKKPSLLKFFPTQIFGCIKFALGKTDLTQLKESLFSFLCGIENVNALVKEFWDKNEKRIKKWYIKKDDDVIISASPEFLLVEICRRLGIKSLIATKMDEKMGKISGKNCKGEEKVARFSQGYELSAIDKFYSDSLSDLPLARLARKAYLVKKEKVSEWKF